MGTVDIIIAVVVVVVLIYAVIQYAEAREWQSKTAAASFIVGQRAKTKDEREWGYRNALLAGNKKAEKFYYYSAIEKFEKEKPLTIFYRELCGKTVPYIFVDYYIATRDHVYAAPEQISFCRRIYRFEAGKDNCIDIFCPAIAKIYELYDYRPTIVFMPCSSEGSYSIKFKALSSALKQVGYDTLYYSMEYLHCRPSKHLSKDRSAINASSNIIPCADIVGRKVIILDDVISTGNSIRQHAEELRQYGVEVVGVVCLGRTVQSPNLKKIRKQAVQDDD